MDSVEGFLEPEEGGTDTEAGGAEAGGLGCWETLTLTLICHPCRLRPCRCAKAVFFQAPTTTILGPERTLDLAQPVTH